MTNRHTRLTLPVETGMDAEIRAIMDRLGADAIRNSDGTSLPQWAVDTAAKVYATYFPARGDDEWASLVPEERVCQFLMSEPVTAFSQEPLCFNVMSGYLSAQFAPATDVDLNRYWQVIDRTTGDVLSGDEWSVESAPPLPLRDPVAQVGDIPHEASSATVTISNPRPYHVYTVSFLARQIWDSTQIYNYLTNGWAHDPSRLKDRTYDVAYPRTWDHAKEALGQWLVQHPEVDVVRFTSFFYHFTLAFDDRGREKNVDWFGYSASVSVPALEEFAEEHGYWLTPEDFVDAGYYNSPFRNPTSQFRDWIDFLSRRVAQRAAVLVEQVHQAGREAMMFLGDNWIGTEPYGAYFPTIGLDAVVGSVGSAATCRMISDIPAVSYTEGRFLPYFFPDVFNPQGDPVKEANESWTAARRAIVRSPLDRIGYGGYLSLATQFPDFIDRIEQIVAEFRSLHELSGGDRPVNAAPVVAVVNAWGELRSWQTHMVAHALWYRQIYSYQGVLESLAGLPFAVKFVSFDDIIGAEDSLNGVDVLINAGAPDTAFSGGEYWSHPVVQERIRGFVAEGGGFVGVGGPTAHSGASGTTFALADVLGVDLERGWSLSTDRYMDKVGEGHFITKDLDRPFDYGEDPGTIVALDATVQIEEQGSVRLATHDYGSGRSCYLAGLPYSPHNSRLLHRVLMWCAGAEEQWFETPVSDNPAVEAAWYPLVNRVFAYNNEPTPVSATITLDSLVIALELDALEGRWLDL